MELGISLVGLTSHGVYLLFLSLAWGALPAGGGPGRLPDDFKYRFLSQSHPAAILKAYRLGWLVNNRRLFLRLLEAGGPRAESQHGWLLGRALSRVADSRLLAVSSRDGSREERHAAADS